MSERIVFLLSRLNGSGSDDELNAVEELRLFEDKLPALLLEKYKKAKKWQERSACVYYSMRYAKTSKEAIELGILALNDKSNRVKHRACMLLAFSLNRDVVPTLRNIATKITDVETLEDFYAVIDAIEHQNSNYFVDRKHTGKMVMKMAGS